MTSYSHPPELANVIILISCSIWPVVVVTVVEHSAHNPQIKGLNTATGTRKSKKVSCDARNWSRIGILKITLYDISKRYYIQ
jgi:hypothetical protein